MTTPRIWGVGGRRIVIRLPIWESNPEPDAWLIALDKKSLVRGFTYGMICDYTGFASKAITLTYLGGYTMTKLVFKNVQPKTIGETIDQANAYVSTALEHLQIAIDMINDDPLANYLEDLISDLQDQVYELENVEGSLQTIVDGVGK